MFGADFAHQVFALEPGGWRGPVKSGYGFHLVFVARRTPKAPKPFETVRDEVLAEWRGARQTELSRAYLVELRKKYGVELDDRRESGAGLRARTERSRKMSWQFERSRLFRRAAIGYLWPIVLAAAIALLLSERASAHEVRPAYLSVQEEAPNEFSVLFKTPMQGDARLALKALFSARIETVTPIVSRPTGDAMVQTWRMRTLEPLAGQTRADRRAAEHHDGCARARGVRDRKHLDGAADTQRAIGNDPGVAKRLGRLRHLCPARHRAHRLRLRSFAVRHRSDVDRARLAQAGEGDHRLHGGALHHLNLRDAGMGDAAVAPGGGDDCHQYCHGRGRGRAYGAREAQPGH